MDNITARRRYINTLCMVYVEAVTKLTKGAPVLIEYAVNNGIYTYIEGINAQENGLVDKIRSEMDSIISADIKIKKQLVDKAKAVEIFKKQGFDDKVKLLAGSQIKELRIYQLDSLYYNFVGGVFSSTGEITSFKLEAFHEGIILVHPGGYSNGTPSNELAYIRQEKLFEISRESDDWDKLMEIDNAGDLNAFVLDGSLEDIILISEALHEKKIVHIADEIYRREDNRLILIAGPSSSGKTTFARRLGIQLRVLGKKYFALGLDDYFIDRDKTPLDESGKPNFDMLDAIDLDAFSSDLRALLEGEEVTLPSYNFISGKREYKNPPVTLNPDTYIIIEGIHALNENFTRRLGSYNKFKIYISALTQLNIDNHNRIPTTDLRLIRRIVRDNATRGYSPEHTIAMWSNVVAGENKNIFPFQENADIMFNSSLIYELAILKGHALPLLLNVEETSPYYSEVKRLVRFLSFFEASSCDAYIANTSILREFIGNSCFEP